MVLSTGYQKFVSLFFFDGTVINYAKRCKIRVIEESLLQMFMYHFMTLHSYCRLTISRFFILVRVKKIGLAYHAHDVGFRRGERKRMSLLDRMEMKRSYYTPACSVT
jgi:hypothetical protein